MVQAKAQVYGGQEGSGLAQVVDTSRLPVFWQNVQKQRTAKELQRMKRRNDAMKDFNKSMDKMATPSYLHQDEFFNMSKGWREEVAKVAAENPLAMNDPSSGLARMIREGQKAEELYASQSKYVEDQWNNMRSELGKGNYRDDVINDTLQKMSQAGSMKEQYELAKNGLIPDLNEWDIFDYIETPIDENTYENKEGVKTTTKRPNEDKTRMQATAFFGTELGKKHLQSGIADGLFQDTPSAVDWVVKNRMSMEGTTTSTTREGNKGGLEFNFGGGGNKADYGDYSVVMYEQGVEDPLAEGGVNRNVPSGFGDDGISFDIAYKGKSAQANTYTAEGGKTERGYVKRIEANPNDPDGAVLVIKSTAKIDTDNFDPDKDSIDRLPTVRVPLNEDNKATLQNTVGMDFDEVIQQYRDAKGIKAKSKSKVNPTTPQEDKGAKGKWGSSKTKIGAE